MVVNNNETASNLLVDYSLGTSLGDMLLRTVAKFIVAYWGIKSTLHCP